MTALTKAFGAVLLLVGAIQLSAAWSGALAPAVLVGAVLAAYGSMLLTGRSRLPAVAVAPVWLVLIAGAGLLAARESGTGWLGVLRDAVPRLLTAPRPAPATLDLLLPGIMLTVLIGLWVGARSVRPGTGRFAPVVGAGALYLAGALLTAGQADPYGVIAALLVLTAVAGWAVSERATSRGAQRLAVIVPATATSAAVVAVVVALLLPAGIAFEPRNLVAPPALPLVERNPLPRLAALAKQDPNLFHHTAGQRRLRLVTLTSFDGSAWESGSVYRPLGVVGPTALPGGSRQTDVRTAVVIDTLDGPWLPAPGRPQSVTGAGVGASDLQVDVESGSIVVAGGARSGLRYEVLGTIDTPDETELTVAPVPPAAEFLGVPRLPFFFADYGQRVVQGASTPFEQAVLIEGAVRQGRRLDLNAPAGSSYARLQTFLFGEANAAGAQAGTSEQFAGAFAILARAAGLPTRLVFGFGSGEQQRDGSWLVRGRDAIAWPEVYFSGQGWVPFDPSPAMPDTSGPSAEAKRQVFERVGQAPPPPPQPPPSRPLPNAGAPAATPSAEPVAVPARPAPVDSTAWALRTFALVPIIVLGSLLLARRLRRFRHRRAGPRGAWSEVLDLLVLLDRPPAAWHTTHRIAGDVASAYPAAAPHPVWRLARWADRASFSGTSTVDNPWPELRRLHRAVRRATPWYRRLMWTLDPRPLWRR